MCQVVESYKWAPIRWDTEIWSIVWVRFGSVALLLLLLLFPAQVWWCWRVQDLLKKFRGFKRRHLKRRRRSLRWWWRWKREGRHIWEENIQSIVLNMLKIRTCPPFFVPFTERTSSPSLSIQRNSGFTFLWTRNLNIELKFISSRSLAEKVQPGRYPEWEWG